ncbi:arylesterase [uncultured Desulfosarcina sp.]|uniref:arylesterase n=1 Tax=uncultured Desulfosarcina sp. TaxID=218289 RepID=UPI0029C7ECF3|nr:arylesterase [uncultured Desulfosarcina sp.]
MNNGSTLLSFFKMMGKRIGLLMIGLGLLVAGCNQEPTTQTPAPVVKAPAPAYEGTIVAVGDSLTAGLGVDEDMAYPAQLERRLKVDRYDFRVVNAGVSGETSSGALARIDWVIASLQPDIVILETGANDGLRGLDPDLLLSNLDRLVDRLKSQNIQVILAGMQMLPNLGPDYIRAFADIYPRIADKHGILLIPFFLEGVAGRPELNQDDRMHPTAEGYARIVETVYPTVVTAIQRHRSLKIR